MISGVPELKDVIKGDLAENGDWIVASVEPRMSWPVEPQKLVYGGVELWVLPVTKDHYPGVAVNLPRTMHFDDAQRTILRFLSAISWVEGRGIVLESFTGGSLPRPMRRQQTHVLAIQEDFDFSYLPEPSDERAQLALALIREGRGLNHPAYGFLSFYKVLEVAFPDGKLRGRWMSAHIDQLRDSRGRDAVAALRANNVAEVGEHLQKSGRQAIAHAASYPIINPDDPTDARRLSSELPIISALAELAIEEELGVETRQTVWEKHLYELEGFKKLLGNETVASIVKGDQIDCVRILENMPALGVELRKLERYEPLTNLQPVSLSQRGSTLTLLTASVDKCCEFACRLDFANERLHFYIETDLRLRDAGTAESAEMLAELQRFVRDYLCNGQLRIVKADTAELLSRKDAFIPMNCIVNIDGLNAQIESWKSVAHERRATGIKCPES